jgi:hypothetical protein
MPVANNLQSFSAVIAAAGTKSAAVNVAGVDVLRLETDAAIVGTALTFEVSSDNATFKPLYNAAGAVSVTVAASRGVQLAAGLLSGINYIKVVSGSTETAGTTVVLICS